MDSSLLKVFLPWQGNPTVCCFIRAGTKRSGSPPGRWQEFRKEMPSGRPSPSWERQGSEEVIANYIQEEGRQASVDLTDSNPGAGRLPLLGLSCGWVFVELLCRAWWGPPLVGLAAVSTRSPQLWHQALSQGALSWLLIYPSIWGWQIQSLLGKSHIWRPAWAVCQVCWTLHSSLRTCEWEAEQALFLRAVAPVQKAMQEDLQDLKDCLGRGGSGIFDVIFSFFILFFLYHFNYWQWVPVICISFKK